MTLTVLGPGESLGDRHVDPDLLWLRRKDDLQSRSETGPGAADPPAVTGTARVPDLHPVAEQLDLELYWFEHGISECRGRSTAL